MNSMHRINKVVIIILLLINLLFLTYVMIISFYNVPQTDDYYFIYRFQSLGFFKSVYWWYMNWQGRFLPHIFTNLSLLGFKYFNTLILNSVFLFLLYFISFFCLLKKLISIRIIMFNKWDYIFISSISILLFNLILLFHFDTSTFFWISASQCYFGGFGFFLLGSNFLFNYKSDKLSYVIIVFSFLFVGCSMELFSVLISIILFFSILLSIYLKNYKYFKNLLFAFSSCFISFLIMYFSPGTEIRMNQVPLVSITTKFLNSQIYLNDLVLNIMPINSKYLIICFLSATYFGFYFKSRKFISSFNVRNLVSVGVFIFFVSLSSVYILVIGSSSKPPLRAYVHLSGFIVLSVFLFGFLFGQKLHSTSFSLSLICISLAISFFFISTIYRFRFNLIPTINYANSVRARTSLAIKLNNQKFKGIVYVDSLENSSKNILISHHFSSNTKDTFDLNYNKAFEKCYNLSFKIFEKP
jgi:hypothetical protein